jgi:cell fate regulator YaaT (PSP1 superfamily)
MALLKIQLESQNRAVYVVTGEALKKGNGVIVSLDTMEHLGEVIDRFDAMEPCLKGTKASFVRIATPEDVQKRNEQRQIEDEAFRFCQKSAKDLNLLMKLVKVHNYFDGSKIMFYYTAESRVDFRELVKILAHKYRTRIEMRQIGVRDETKLCGGRGHCGLQLCCSIHLCQFAPVTVKMAKDQGLSLNPAKISGMCGRLMCCLRYELEPDKIADETSENSN